MDVTQYEAALSAPHWLVPFVIAYIFIGALIGMPSLTEGKVSGFITSLLLWLPALIIIVMLPDDPQ